MKKFITKYDIQHFNGCEMNPYDAVDRLSYVDSTTQIVRMMKAGVNMRLQNSQLTAYDGDMNAPSMPVYAPDISQAYKELHELQDKLKENQRLYTEQLKRAKEAVATGKSTTGDGVTAKADTSSGLPSST